MLQGNTLVLRADNDFVDPHDISHPDRMDTHFVFRAFPLTGAARIGRRIRTDFLHRVEQSQRRAARSVQLPVVMLLNDLDLRVGYSASAFLTRSVSAAMPSE